MAKVNWTIQSIKDIENIAEFIAKDSEKYATIQTQRFFEIVTALEFQPHIGKKVPEINKSNIRELILGNYRIIYVIKLNQDVDIITVHHSKRLLINNPSVKKRLS